MCMYVGSYYYTTIYCDTSLKYIIPRKTKTEEIVAAV